MNFIDEHFMAAELIDKAYNSLGEGLIFPYSLNVMGVQAYLTEDKVLVIPGTNEKSDWFKFNFKVGRGSTRTWHKGFLAHAQTVYGFAKSLEPRLIVGHSLGAASAQIVGYSLQVPTIAFASPKPLVKGLEIPHNKWTMIQNICREDDLVCALPPNFQHVGFVNWLAPKKHHWGEDHRIDNYVDAMKEANE